MGRSRRALAAWVYQFRVHNGNASDEKVLHDRLRSKKLGESVAALQNYLNANSIDFSIEFSALPGDLQTGGDGGGGGGGDGDDGGGADAENVNPCAAKAFIKHLVVFDQYGLDMLELCPYQLHADFVSETSTL